VEGASERDGVDLSAETLVPAGNDETRSVRMSARSLHNYDTA
jgi:hypothetical protein